MNFWMSKYEFVFQSWQICIQTQSPLPLITLMHKYERHYWLIYCYILAPHLKNKNKKLNQKAAYHIGFWNCQGTWDKPSCLFGLIGDCALDKMTVKSCSLFCLFKSCKVNFLYQIKGVCIDIIIWHIKVVKIFCDKLESLSISVCAFWELQTPRLCRWMGIYNSLFIRHMLSDSTLQPDPGSHYTAWSSMSTLISKGYITKEGSPAK